MCSLSANGCTLRRCLASIVLQAVLPAAQSSICLTLQWIVAALFLLTVVQACGLSGPRSKMCSLRVNGCTLRRCLASIVLLGVLIPTQVYIFLGLPWIVVTLFWSAVLRMIVMTVLCVYNMMARHCAAPIADVGPGEAYAPGRQQRRQSKKAWTKVSKKLRRLLRSKAVACAIPQQHSQTIIKIVIAFVYAGMAACFLAVAVGIVIVATWFFMLFLCLLLLRVFCIFQPPDVILHWCIQAGLHAYIFGHPL